MDSFIIRLADFYCMKKEDGSFLDSKRKSYVIPKYQREYAWDDNMILDLINDVEDRDKFLGIIILDSADDRYEIIDGQQRITTCYMILAAIYNAYSKSPREQESIVNIIQPFGENVLKNESIGEFLVVKDNRIDLLIPEDPNIDIYNQRESFLRAYKCIQKAITEFDEQKKLKNFYRKLKDCQFLILINDEHGSTKPVEQIFLDINEKSELLNPSDIFKGHCFEKFDDDNAEDLKKIWVELKKCAISFHQKFKVKNLSEYIYNYLLITDNNKVTEKLRVNGKHYLYDYDMDDTEALLNRMIAYGRAIIQLREDIDHYDYYFENLCSDASNYRQTNDHRVLKAMFRDILGLEAQYPKLPILYWIFTLASEPVMSKEIEYNAFKSIATNLYVYAMLWVLSLNKKSKEKIDYSIRDALIGEDDAIKNTLICAKELRKKQVDEFNMPLKCNDFNILSFLYSIMDNYVSNNNWLGNKYDRDEEVNLEHFVMPDSDKIDWIRNNEGRTIFSIPVRKSLAKEYKKSTANYLLLNEELNRSLHSYDIIEKIKLIKQWFKAEGDDERLPKHIRIIIRFIEKMELYKELVRLKDQNESDYERIGNKYFAFLEDYFGESRKNALLVELRNGFQESFHN